MATGIEKAKSLRELANGNSLKKTAKICGISTTTVNQRNARLLRGSDLERDVKSIHANPQPYLDIANKIEQDPTSSFSSSLSRNISNIIKSDDINPKYLSNLSASILMNAGLTLSNVTELQQWMVKSDSSLKMELPKSDTEIKIVTGAISILKVYNFDTSVISNQLENIISKDTD